MCVLCRAGLQLLNTPLLAFTAVLARATVGEMMHTRGAKPATSAPLMATTGSTMAQSTRSTGSVNTKPGPNGKLAAVNGCGTLSERRALCDGSCHGASRYSSAYALVTGRPSNGCMRSRAHVCIHYHKCAVIVTAAHTRIHPRATTSTRECVFNWQQLQPVCCYCPNSRVVVKWCCAAVANDVQAILSHFVVQDITPAACQPPQWVVHVVGRG